MRLSIFQFNQLGPLPLPSFGVFDFSTLSAADAVQELVSDDKVSILYPLVLHVPLVQSSLLQRIYEFLMSPFTHRPLLGAYKGALLLDPKFFLLPPPFTLPQACPASRRLFPSPPG
jgi:hypothetical protein